MSNFEKPMGGTELMMEELKRRLPRYFVDNSPLSIVNYIPHADFSKKVVLWNQLSYDQDAIQWMKDPANIEKVDHFVFVSYWQYEMFRKIFGIPAYKSTVIKNAHLGTYRKTINENKIKLCYTSTPWRGLDVLTESWKKLNQTYDLSDCELHVFSGTKIYGKDFDASSKDQYKDLFDELNKLPNVMYHGNKENKMIRALLPNMDILAYPNTFEETSCISVIEALSSGIRVVTSSLGALPETTEGWSRMYEYPIDREKHIEIFSEILYDEIEARRTDLHSQTLKQQKELYGNRWGWDARISEWEILLSNI